MQKISLYVYRFFMDYSCDFFERNNKILKRSIIEYIYIQKKFGGRRNQYNYFPLFQITKIKVAVAKTLCEINKILSFAWKENYFINVK